MVFSQAHANRALFRPIQDHGFPFPGDGHSSSGGVGLARNNLLVDGKLDIESLLIGRGPIPFASEEVIAVSPPCPHLAG